MNWRMTSSLMVLFTMACASPQAPSKKATPPVDDSYREASFDSMKSLVGTWYKVGKDAKDFHIKFGLTAGDTVLVESWISHGKTHSLTLYHRDKSGLISTHYCPQGNQPRMTLEHKPASRDVSFVFRDATNLEPTKQSYQTALTFEFQKDANAVIRHETYQGKQGPDTSSLNLRRLE